MLRDFRSARPESGRRSISRSLPRRAALLPPILLLLILLSLLSANPVFAKNDHLVKLTAEERSRLNSNHYKLNVYFNAGSPPVVSPSGKPISARIGRRHPTLADLEGQQTATVSGYAIETHLRHLVRGRFEPGPAQNAPHGLRAVSFGQMGARVENLSGAAFLYIEQGEISGLRAAGGWGQSFDRSTGANPKHPLVSSTTQKALTAVPADAPEGAGNRSISRTIKSWMSPQTLLLLKLVAFFTALLLLFLGGISYWLKRRLDKKVATLESAHKSLLEQAEFLGLATEATQAGVWDLRLAEDMVYLSEQWYAMLGYERRDNKPVHRGDLRKIMHPEDIFKPRQFFESNLMKGGPNKFESEHRLLRNDGTWCWVLSKGRAVEWNTEGIPTRVIGLDVNIQTIKYAQEKTATSEARFRSLFQNAPIPMALVGFDGKVLEVNNELTETSGYTIEELIDLENWWKMACQDSASIGQARSTWEKVISGVPTNDSEENLHEYPFFCKDGTELKVVVAANLVGETALVSFFDLTERRQKETALRETMESLRATLNATPDGVLVVEQGVKVIQTNDQFYEMWNIPPELQKIDDDAVLREFVQDQLVNPAAFRKMVDTLYNSRTKDVRELHFRDGRVFECYSAPMLIGGQEIGRVWDFRDISERKRNEEALRESESRLRSIFAAMTDVILIMDAEGRYLEIAPTNTALLYRPADELLGNRLADIFPPEKAEQMLDAIRQALSLQRPVHLDHELTIGKRQVWFAATVSPLSEDRVIWVSRNITDRRQAEEMLHQSEDKFVKVFMMTPDLMAITRLEDGLTIEVNLSFEEITGWKRSEVIGQKSTDLGFWADPAARDLMVRELKAGRDISHREIDFRKNDGTRRQGLYSARKILITDEPYLIFNMQDITDRIHLEEERRKLEQHFQQSQKLEAVGTLAGGVAHDFNNMLGAIIGYAELALGMLAADDSMRHYFVQIFEAAQRSADLTRQLLAFARKQTMEPLVFDLNDSVKDMLKMLRRLIGENIELKWLPAVEQCVVKMDPSQLDQVLANLCVNARDAIADVGKIIIRTGTVSFDEVSSKTRTDILPGEYILLSVSDNGCGMDPETMSHVFEPFYTTKEVGRGTGLGLSTVYGIVKQNQGDVRIYSEPGLGTTFNIYLPRHGFDISAEQAQTDQEPPRGRGETILLVEDDSEIREMGQLMLERLGYTVIVGATPSQAIQLVEEAGADIQLFITDVVMPEMNGRELADRLLKIRPNLKHLFMSGYTADIIAHQGVLNKGVNFIQKPFTLQALGVKVRKILDR